MILKLLVVTAHANEPRFYKLGTFHITNVYVKKIYIVLTEIWHMAVFGQWLHMNNDHVWEWRLWEKGFTCEAEGLNVSGITHGFAELF